MKKDFTKQMITGNYHPKALINLNITEGGLARYYRLPDMR